MSTAHSTPSVFTAQEAHTIQNALHAIESKRLRGNPVLRYFDDFEKYLVLRFAGLCVEECHIIYLDHHHRLLAAEVAAHGDQKSVAPNFRHIAHRAITLGADAIAIAHNHPTDTDWPSGADLAQLEWAERALGWLNIAVLDSYVVTSQRVASIKQHRQRADEEAQARRVKEREARAALQRQKRQAKKSAKLVAQLQGLAA